MDADAMEEKVLEAQVASMMQRIFGAERRTHDDIERDIRRDKYEMGKVLRERNMLRGLGATNSGLAKSADRGSVILAAIRGQLSSEFSATVPTRTRYEQLCGLRCFIVVAAERIQLASTAPHSHVAPLPAVEGSMRHLDDTTTALLQRCGTAPVEARDAVGESAWILLAAQDTLAAVADANGKVGGIVPRLRWRRALLHRSSGMLYAHAFLPPLPIPSVRLDKYVSLVMTLVASAHCAMPADAGGYCRALLQRGVSRTPTDRPGQTNADGSRRLAADADGGVLSDWWPKSPCATSASACHGRHCLLLIKGNVFSVDMVSKQGYVYPLGEVSRVVADIFVAAASANARNAFTRCGTLTLDNLVDVSEQVQQEAKQAYQALRHEAGQLASHERLIELLETARFVVCFDASSTSTLQAILASRESSIKGPAGSVAAVEYPSYNRWLVNALNVVVDAEGGIEVSLPQAIASEPGASTSLVDGLAAFLTRRLTSFDPLFASGVVTARNEAALPMIMHRCVWATGLVFRMLSVTPGKVTLCLLVEQLHQYCNELQRLVPDAEERDALHVACDAFQRMICPDKGQLGLDYAMECMRAFLDACRPFFRTMRHPTIASPLHVPSHDAEHTALLTHCIVNPFIGLARRHASLAAQGDEEELAQDATSDSANAVLDDAIGLTPAGSFKIALLEKLERFSDPVVDGCRYEPIDLFSQVPSKAQRKMMIVAASKIGYHAVHESEVLGAVEDLAKKQYQRLLYSHERLLERCDPWRAYRFSYCEDAPEAQTEGAADVAMGVKAQTTDTIVVRTEELLKLSRRVSRFAMDQWPHLEDDALAARFAHPDCVIRALVSLASQLATAHVLLPVTPIRVEDLLGMFCRDRAVLGHETLIAGEIVSARDFLELYYGYLLPRLCSAAKTAVTATHKAAQTIGATLLRLLLHHYEPVRDEHHVRWVGAVQRRPVGDQSVAAVDAGQYAKALGKEYDRVASTGINRHISWALHLDLLDCATRCGPLETHDTPCIVGRLNTSIALAARSPCMGIAFKPTEELNAQTGDNIAALLRAIRRQRVHTLEQANITTRNDPHSGRTMTNALQVHIVRVKTVRYIDHTVLEELHVDVRGVWASDAFASGFMKAFQACFTELWNMWSHDV